MPDLETARLFVEVRYDAAVTDAESLAAALDMLMETALSTPELLDDYGNPNIGEFFATGKRPTRHVSLIEVTDPDTKNPVALEVRKMEGGYLVGIDASYLEQDVGPVYDPCNFGVELEIPDDEA